MIAAISLQGFKSFADKVRLEFDGGVCAVIGPNGSGKSNVVEAIRWVTHGARARELRAGRGRELIFHGSGGKAPLGLAEVTLELRGLPQHARLNLSRRVYRDGAAEQDLMGRPARARDVQSALRGSGLGPGGLAVIGQGEVSGVVQAEGATLLGYLEEAAGLSAGRAAQAEARAKLHDAGASLATLRLLEEERAAWAGALSREAASARRARSLQARELALHDTLARARRRDLGQDIERLRAREHATLTESAEVAALLVGAQSEQAAAREAIAELRTRVQARAALRDALEAAEGAARQALGYLDHLRAEERRLLTERTALDVAEPPGAPPDLSALDAELSAARRSAEALEAAASGGEARLARLRAEHGRQQEARSRAGAARETLLAELARAEATLARDEAAWQAARRAQDAAPAEHAAARRARAAADLERLRARAAEVGARARVLAASEAPLAREQARLAPLVAGFVRYGEGARNALRSGEEGVVGAVADLLAVPAEYEVAATAALGRRLEQVVVRDADVAGRLIARLRRDGGRATFLPLDLLRPRPRRSGPSLRAPGALGILADLCPSRPDVVAEALLGDTLLIHDLDAATRLARAHAARPRLVTLDGELIEPGGALTGGRLRDTGAGHLADARRLTELDAELQDLRREQAELVALGADLDTEEHALRARLAEAETAQRTAQLAALAGARQLHAAEATVQAARQRHGELRARLDAAPPAALAGETPDLPEAEALQARRLAGLHPARARERAAQAARDAGRLRAQAWSAHLDARERAEQLAGRGVALAKQLADQTRLVGEAQDAARRRRADVDARTGDESALAPAEGRLAELTQTYTSLVGRQNNLRAVLEETRLSLARRETARPELPPGAELPGDARGWQAELGRVQDERARLGAVNARAEEEHARAAADLEALARERRDAENAAAELGGALAALERQVGRQLDVAYARVRRAFGGYARELLGGEGDLQAGRDETGLLRALDLSVQPGGKRTRAMNLLSAGERTMAGLAFLFALGHAAEDHGLPLAVLDEVDAPLDEANIRRFTHFLQGFAARGTQFILVTHQKATMEVASSLWGVTTDASGASRALSIRRAAEAPV